jgi:hypothetical protein
MSFARVRAVVIVSILVVCAAVVVVVTLVKDHQRGRLSTEQCPAGAVLAEVSLPNPENVKINVFNATDKAYLAQNVGTDFRYRKFQVLTQASETRRVDGVAVLRFGPRMVGAAQLLRAYFLDRATLEFARDRTDDTVDVLIGAGFQQLANPTEVNLSLSQLGNPKAPEGTCADLA